MYNDDLINSISRYVETSNNENYNEVISRDNRFEVLYHLSETRKSLFNWYPFRKNANLLEIGAEFGALTGLFCDKCETVTSLVEDKKQFEILQKRYEKYKNLEIKFFESIQEITKQYDYIVIIGKLEYMCSGSKRVADYIEKLKEVVLPRLKEDGTLLIATENRYGVKYFCGERNPITNMPFLGLNRDFSGSQGYMLSRSELISIISGLSMNYKFYYPVPDYKFPQLIYTDNILPKSDLKERVINYSLDKSTLIMSERKLYDDIIDNEVFPFFSNSFLIECNREGHFSNVNYVALSTDRDKKHSFATIINDNNTVNKKALSAEGIRYLKVLESNIKDIASHGISVVPHEFTNNMLVMPFYDLLSLSGYLGKAIRSDVPKFIELFDLLYREILKSSEQVKLEESELFKINSNPDYWGPILKKAYIDMIPLNSFFDGENIIFFDQEFVKDNYPAGYIMFRALKYTYLFMPFANSIVPLEDMKKKYGLIDVWDYYENVEMEFVQDNREFNTYKGFWDLGNIDSKTIKENIDRLIMEEK